jgi:hypothetical protein
MTINGRGVSLISWSVVVILVVVVVVVVVEWAVVLVVIIWCMWAGRDGMETCNAISYPTIGGGRIVSKKVTINGQMIELSIVNSNTKNSSRAWQNQGNVMTMQAWDGEASCSLPNVLGGFPPLEGKSWGSWQALLP